MKDISIGDSVKIFGKEFSYIGIVMPSQDEDILILKLENGYNIGVLKSKVQSIRIIKQARPPVKNTPKIKSKTGLPNISIITTGGTITSKVDYRTGAVHSLIKPEELIANIPELAKLANIKIVSPFSKWSEDLSPQDFQKIANAVAIELNKGADGVIVTQGTDTLHFTSASITFMLKDLSKPVAVVGGQRSSDRGSFDGAQNLICAVHYCLSNIAEVAVVMHANSDDDFCYALRGTKVRKMHSSRRDAFRPINCLPLAKIDPKKGVEILVKDFKKKTNKKTIVDIKLEPKVAMIKYYPGLQPDILDYYIDKGYKGIIIEGTGFGNTGTDTWIKPLERATKHAIVCMTTQTIYGTTNNHVYSAGVLQHKAGVVYCKDTLPETAYIKLMILLGQNKNLEEIKHMMTQNIAGEINERIEKKSFMY
jgi:glutamyl-tRNA(Gln) amidotransferase subunit D